jgi:hypothetical protein
MRSKLQIAAALLALVIVGIWLFGGRNTGWTKNSVPHKVKDPVTELEVDVYDKRFVPGLDFLGGGLAVASLVAAGSLLFRRRAAQSAR